MSLPTVAELCRSIPTELFPSPGFETIDASISAVHVSELSEPAGYLSGGELLLTTGLSLPRTAVGCERYVARLKQAGLSALGLGLGPTFTIVPDRLARACTEQDLCLLVVPPAAAFLTVSKAYWAARTRSSQQGLTDALSAHRSLVDAMATIDPVGQTLKALSRAIGGWAGLLDPAGVVRDVFPRGRTAEVLAVQGEIGELMRAGAHASAAFPVGDEVVAVFPLPIDDRVIGYLAVGSEKRLDEPARRLVLTAGSLLSLDSVQQQRADAGLLAKMHAVSELVDMGLADPGWRLAYRLGLPGLGEDVRLLVVRTARPDEVYRAVHSWSRTVVGGAPDLDRSWFIVPAVHAKTARLAQLLRAADPGMAAVLSDVLDIATVHRARVGLSAAVATILPGELTVPPNDPSTSEGIELGLRAVLNYGRADLSGALIAYLRHRGQWEAAANELRVHRNTLRHRVDTIRTLTGFDIDHPDHAAEAWLHLRRNGLA